MARPTKSIATKTGLMTKEEINKRLEWETRLRGKSEDIRSPSFLSQDRKSFLMV